MDSTNNTNNIEIRRIQALTGERSLTLVFPKQFAIELGIAKGDFLKCSYYLLSARSKDIKKINLTKIYAD